MFSATGSTARLNVQNHARVRRILAQLEAAAVPEDMNLPGLFFHRLVGREVGRYSVRVTGNWRITFGFEPPDAIEVDLQDYH